MIKCAYVHYFTVSSWADIIKSKSMVKVALALGTKETVSFLLTNCQGFDDGLL